VKPVPILSTYNLKFSLSINLMDYLIFLIELWTESIMIDFDYLFEKGYSVLTPSMVKAPNSLDFLSIDSSFLKFLVFGTNYWPLISITLESLLISSLVF
jgi:hypothetical protein